jgi:hypothetical protein
MRGTLLIAVVLAGLWTTAGPVQAGLYSTEEPPILQFAGDYRGFQKAIGELRGLASEKSERTDPKTGYESPRVKVKKRVAELEAKARAGTVTMQERINLSAHYIRLGENNNAVTILGEAELRKGPYAFMALANLATANLNLGLYERAEANLAEAIESWPKSWPGWTTQQVEWFRRVERYQLRLVMSRESEARKPGPKREQLDLLFPKVTFQGPGGRYRAGLLDDRQWDQLPADALRIIVQLVYWMPFDNRLYWLLAEVLNANNEPMSAYALMDELTNDRSGYTADELKAHRQALWEAKGFWDTVRREKDRLLWEKARFALSPLRGMLPPVVGFLFEGGGWLKAVKVVNENPTQVSLDSANNPDDAKADDAAESPAESRKSFWDFNWQHVAVSFGAGAVIATLLSMQLRELRRRKQATEPAVKGEE